MKEDKVNHPSHYKGLKNLFIKAQVGPDVKFIPAEVIDVIEAYTEHLTGGCATNVGNCVKYLGRLGKKAPDGSYQATQREKDLEDLKKAQWYLTRAIKCFEELKEEK